MTEPFRMFTEEDKRRLNENLARFGADYRKRALAASKQVNEFLERMRGPR